MKKKINLRKYIKPVLFILLGIGLALLFYWKVGCVSGVCKITSSPFLSTLYGGFFGYLLCLAFTPEGRNGEETPPEAQQGSEG